MIKKRGKFIFPFIALICMLLDGQATQLLTSLSYQHNVISTQCLVICMITGYFLYGDSAYMLIVATVMGVFYDLYFYGIIGIWTLCLPLMIFLLHHCIAYVPKTFPMYWMMFVLCHIWMIFVPYFIQVIFGLTQINWVTYIVLYVAPALLVNAILDLIVLFYGEKYYFNITKTVAK